MAKELKPLSIVVVEKTTQEGRKFMTAKVRASIAYAAGARITLEALNENINFDVKLAKSTGMTLPAKEGIYEVDSATAFQDMRADCKRPTLWIKQNDAEGAKLEFVFKKPLPTDPNATKPQQSTICILDEE